jgi:hypothetical protein
MYRTVDVKSRAVGGILSHPCAQDAQEHATRPSFASLILLRFV